MKMLSKKLAGIFNLTAYEARVFMALSQFDNANISEISRASAIPRTAIYASIKNLLEKGLISQVVLGKRKQYKALTPEELQSIFEWKKRDLSFVVAELSKKMTTSDEQFEVLFFPGKNGLNSTAEVFLKNSTSKIWRTFENSVVNQPSLEFYQLEDYIDRRVEKGIKAKVILTLNMMYPFLKERLSKDQKELRETILVPEKDFPFKVVIAIDDTSVMILSGEDHVFGAIIKNAAIAQTLGTIHEMIWNRYK
jgi:sugar-specific transcriptional regulator TrmB